MELLLGPSFTIDVASSSAFLTSAPPPHDTLSSAAICSLAEEHPEDGVDYRSDSSSSIGDPDDDSDDDDDDEAVRTKSNGRFGSLGSLEESLPIKRGLSNHFSGKSKSFVNLAEANSVKDIEKQENTLNKRRRILIASKWIRKSSFYSWPNPKSMPLLALEENEEEESQVPFKEDDDDEDEEPRRKRVLDFHQRKIMSFKSRSCFSFADLQQHHDQQ